MRPGPRSVLAGVYYPRETRASIGPATGIALTLHNWGGTGEVGTADPRVLARELNVVAITVDYLQSGQEEGIRGPEPYDFGWLQALDALRALWAVFHELDLAGQPFARGRLYATGGSGGGNVALMANKLAPRTFAGVVDLCGMTRLSDDIAFDLPGGSTLNARWSRDPASRAYLAPGAQDLRWVGNPAHLRVMKSLGASARVVVVHGVDDGLCPSADARELVENLQSADLDVVPVWVDVAKVDGQVFTSTGHGLGDRTRIVLQTAGAWLRPGGAEALVRAGRTDFERREEIRYPVRGGEVRVSYAEGFPVGFLPP